MILLPDWTPGKAVHCRYKLVQLDENCFPIRGVNSPMAIGPAADTSHN